ncbi:DUF3515 domain-containing protein [soil metagenome]
MVAVPVVIALAVVLNLSTPPVDGPASVDGPTAGPRAELPPLDVQTPEITEVADALCPGVMGGLPLLLDDAQARPVRSASAYAAAWGDPPIVLRCGVPRPAGYVVGASSLLINGVDWYAEPGADQTVWTTVDREVYVEVSVPSARASAPIATLSAVIADRLPAQTPRPGE